MTNEPLTPDEVVRRLEGLLKRMRMDGRPETDPTYRAVEQAAEWLREGGGEQ